MSYFYQTQRQEATDQWFQTIFKEYVETNNLKTDDYLFDRRSNKTEKKRIIVIGSRINGRIKNSNAIKKPGNHKFSSHMFRKTVAFTAFQKQLAKAKD